MRTLTRLAAIAIALAACSNGSSTGNGGAPPYPAFTPTMPQLQRGWLTAIVQPVLVPVYFSGETLRGPLDGALSSWITSAGAKAVLGEYGTQSGSSGASIALSEAAPAALASEDIEKWLVTKLDGTHQEFGPVDISTLAARIFVIYYPPSTTITYGGMTSCTTFRSYGAGVTLEGGAVAHYVVAPRCAAPPEWPRPSGPSSPPAPASWNTIGNPMASLAPSPSPPSGPSSTSGWASFDGPHAKFGAFGAQLASACTLSVVSIQGTPAIRPSGPPLTVRAWSNAAAGIYHDPCVPAPLPPYFLSVPRGNNPLWLPSGETTLGVSVPVGQSKTIDVQLLSEAATSGAWTVSTRLVGSSGFTFALDRTTGLNGDVLHLTVTAPSTPSQDVVVVFSTLDQRQSFWLLPVQSN